MGPSQHEKAGHAQPIHQAMTTIIRPAQFNDWRAGPTWSPLAFEAARPEQAGDGPALLLGVYLEDWLSEVVRRSVRPKTYVSYRGVVMNHLIPDLGQHPLVELRPADVQAFLNRKAASGLAPRTVAYLRNVLRQAPGSCQAERARRAQRGPPGAPAADPEAGGPTPGP